MAAPTISTVIVAHDSLEDLICSLPALTSELRYDDELVIVDSGSSDGLRERLPEFAPGARIVVADGNVGFAAGTNLGVASARGDLIVLLNPDAVVQEHWSAAIRKPWGGAWAAWMALVTMDRGRTINTSGGVVHFTGLGWSGQAHQPVDRAPAEPVEVGFLSGACLAIPRATWSELGGFPEEFFMYCEDVDISLRLRLRGGRVAMIPDARVVHDYDFDKGAGKWRLLERNRWATMIRTFPGALLVLLVPALLVTELAIWVAAVKGGWAQMKALATLDVLRALPRLLRERAAIQRRRTVSAGDFAAAMTAELSSPYFGGAVRSRAVAGGLRLYWRIVRRLLGGDRDQHLAALTRA
jgi:GT2 family glycosyltransferase